MKKVLFYLPLIIAGTFISCTKPYNPIVTTTNANVLVVEGLINTGADSTFIKLSRTVLISNATTANPETKAIITVENAQSTIYTLTEIAKGTYASPGLNLDNTKQYRIRIKTSNGKTYLSDLVVAKVTPPIDSVGFTLTGNGMQIYANTHDATNNTRYYKYNYQETWQFHAKYYSSYISNGSAVVSRTAAQQIYYCFGNDYSTNTLINSTAALSQDVAFQFPITTIDASSEKIESKYSILLTQFALTKEAYAFWENLKKNTEQLGSIFDAQPSQLVGNIHNVNDASEPVVGYISAGTVQQKRVFITNASLPPGWVTVYPYNCQQDSAFFFNPASKQNEVNTLLIPLPNSSIITDPFFSIFNSPLVSMAPIGFLYTDPDCGDCTVRGRTKQPSFWK
jgi:hypothetical protein